MAGKHTPTPWQAEPKGGRGAWIKGATGEWSALSCGDTDASAAANAEFIVRACNSHEELLEAAETVLAGLTARIDEADLSSVPVFAGIAALSDAIAKAKGEDGEASNG